MMKSDYVYLFYPGTISFWIAMVCRVFRKPYGIYLRGQKFPTSHLGLAILQKAKYINSVATNLVKDSKLELNASRIRPMIEIQKDDFSAKSFVKNNSQENWNLLFVGRLEKDKGVLDVVEACEQLASNSQLRFRLMLVGGGSLYPVLSELSSQLDWLTVVGHIASHSALMQQYEQADFFILPTHHEGFPRVLYEAMAKSNVILTTMVGGIPSVMIPDYNCLEIQVDSPGEIAKVLARAVTSRELMQRVVRNALQTVEDTLKLPPHAMLLADQCDLITRSK
ncbi:MAG: glycosyltransferase family 4 protein [Planctomycetales bacterium]|nr:glycosyltransferase family 4 protein [Planctomycetales bacterium]